MTRRNLLKTIELRDEFSLDAPTLLREAQGAAARLSEICHWTDITVEKSARPTQKAGTFLVHYFDILGAGESVDENTNAETENRTTAETSKIAAKESSI